MTRTWQPKVAASVMTLVAVAGHVAAAAPTGPWDCGLTLRRGQLSRSVTPEHYAISIEADADLSGFHGSAAIDIEVHQRTRQIVLNAADLVFGRVVLDGSGTPESGRTPTTVALDARHETATLSFPGLIAPGPHHLA